MEKKILDVTCGARSIWFNKHHTAAVYCDKRREQFRHLWKNAGNCTLDIDPDIVCDFTDLPFPDNSFPLVVFDPPHLTGAKETAWLVKKYGKLEETWPQMLHDGFVECMRVLKPDGVLIFKWSEYDIPSAEVWKAIGQKPLFGHHSGKRSRTFWACFMKFDERTPQKEAKTRMETDCGKCLHQKVCALWWAHERQDASCFSLDGCDCFEAAITPPNEPLTLEQLREMDGEPVWIVEHPDWGHWELSADAEDYLADRDQDFYALKHDDPEGRYGLHVLGWLAYRRPPEGEEDT